MTRSPREKTVEKLISVLEALFATIWSGSTIGTLNEHAPRAFMSDKGWINLDSKAVKSLEAIVTELHGSTLNDFYSTSYLQKQVISVIQRIAGLPSVEIKKAINDNAQNLVTNLLNTAPKEQRITVPISGVSLWPDNYSVRVGNCLIYSLGNHIETKWFAMVVGDKEISHLLKLEPPGGSKIWIKTIVRVAEGDDEKREEVAFKQIHDSLALLMLYLVLEKRATILWPRLPVIEVGPDKSSSHSAYVVEEANPFFAGEAVSSSTLPTLRLTAETMKLFDEYEFTAVSNILISATRSEVQQAIYDSIRVLYSSFTSPDPVWRYIGLIATLERLLTTAHEGSIKRNLAERLTWILGEGEKPEDRRKIKERMIKIYSLRSEFIHRVTKIETLNDDILQLHIFILSLISKLSKGQFITISGLKQWVDDKMLGF
jgi:hypothetical protein